MTSYELDKSKWGGAAVFDQLLDCIREKRQEFENQKYISQDVVEKFKEIGMYRAFVPESFGGDEKTPVEFMLAVEAISAADGSAGWVSSFGMNPAYLSALPIETLNEIWKDTPDIVFGAGIFPPQPVENVGDKYQLNGRWKFASGCKGASLLGVGIITKDKSDLPRIAVLPAEEFEIDEDSWNVHGMTATGSFDLLLKDKTVSPDWTCIRGGKPNLEGNFFHYPTLSFAAQVLSVTTAGIARGALDLVYQMAEGRKSVTGAPNVADRSYVQIEMAKAEARLRSARSFFYESAESAWDCILTNGEVTPDLVNLLRLSTSHLTRECAEVTSTAYKMVGMTSVYCDHPLSRAFRDVHLVVQHAFMGEITFQNAGAMFFGKKPLPGYL